MRKFINGLLLALTVLISVAANDKESIKCFILSHGLASYDSLTLERIHAGECIHMPPVFITCFPSDLNFKVEPSHIMVLDKTGKTVFDAYTKDSVWICVKDSSCPIKPGPYYYLMEFSNDTLSQQPIQKTGCLNIIED